MNGVVMIVARARVYNSRIYQAHASLGGCGLG